MLFFFFFSKDACRSEGACRKTLSNSRGVFTHHLEQPPQEETHTDLRRAREVELIAESWRKDKVIYVYRDKAERNAIMSYNVCHKVTLKKPRHGFWTVLSPVLLFFSFLLFSQTTSMKSTWFLFPLLSICFFQSLIFCYEKCSCTILFMFHRKKIKKVYNLS